MTAWPQQLAMPDPKMPPAITFVQEHAPRLTKYLISSGCPPQDAEECANDGCLIVVDRWDRLQADPGHSGPRAYLYRVTNRLWYRRRRRETAWRQTLTDLSDRGVPDVGLVVLDVAETVVDWATAAHIVRSTFPKMPRPERQVLWLRLAEDFSTKQTALILKIPEGTVKYRLHTAKRRFKALVIASGELEGTPWIV